MEERRKAERLKDCNEIILSVVSGGKNPPPKTLYNYSEDISVSGAKICTGIYLPVDTLLKINFTLNAIHQQITAFGKVKWIKSILEDKRYEAGVEFVDTPSESIRKIYDYIAWKQKYISLYPEGMSF
jgi:hypothetical protein